MANVDVFKYLEYKEYVVDWVQSQPKKGYGQFRRIAEQIQTSTVFVSQVFKGDRDLQPEHAAPLSEFFQHTVVEEKYFLNLIYLARAATKKLEELHTKEIKSLRKQAHSLKAKVKNDIELSPEALTQFHSGWAYSAIRLISSIPEFRSIHSISDKLKLDNNQAHEIMQFLVEQGLCQKNRSGFEMAVKRTHLPAESPLVKTRQVSWRVKGFEKMDMNKDDNLFITAPMVISQDLREKFIHKLKEVFVEISKDVADSNSEVLTCLNIDLFDV